MEAPGYSSSGSKAAQVSISPYIANCRGPSLPLVSCRLGSGYNLLGYGEASTQLECFAVSF